MADLKDVDDALNAAMLADPDGGPWETALALALGNVVALYGSSLMPLIRDVETEYREAVRRLAEEGSR